MYAWREAPRACVGPWWGCWRTALPGVRGKSFFSASSLSCSSRVRLLQLEGSAGIGIARAHSAPEMAAARVPGVFYLDDPQDGASVHLLSQLGITLSHGSATAGTSEPPKAGSLPVGMSHAAEHTYTEGASVTYSVVGEGKALLDVRDSADAWIRLILSSGDAVVVPASAWRRVPTPGTRAVPAAAFSTIASGGEGVPLLSSRLVPGAVEITSWGAVAVSAPSSSASDVKLRFTPGSEEERVANTPHFLKSGNPHIRDVVVNLCESFYHLGWVTGTGGSISIRHGDRIFMAPSGVQKERMTPQDIFVLDSAGATVFAPLSQPGKAPLKLSQCAPLFQHAFNLRGAGACIHTHDINAMMCTLQNETEWRITHQEMIKGIAGHGFLDECVVPVLENTPHECDLAESLGKAMELYPRSNAVLVRRHGVYVWGSSWEAAKTQAECYHYLFEASVRMRAIGIDPAVVPARTKLGIGAEKSYEAGAAAAAAAAAAHAEGAAGADACCGGGAATANGHTHPSEGFHGVAGVLAQQQQQQQQQQGPPASHSAPSALAPFDAVLLDIEGTTSSIAFVAETLFPYAAAHLEAHLAAAWGSPELASDVELLVRQSDEDLSAGLPGAKDAALPAHLVQLVGDAGVAPGPQRQHAIAVLAANVRAQMAGNRKTGALKSLQGHIWRAGYESGALRGHVYEDTAPALRGWVASGRKVYIYSSGSREAQRLLFANTVAGDLRPLLCGYFDTRSGPKVEAASYSDIALSLGVDAPSRVLFLTDALAEARAAAGAGMQAVLTLRPGNVALPSGHGFRTVDSLLEPALHL